MDNIKNFSIDDILEVTTENSDEFFYAKICVLSTKPNSHKILITKDILQKDGETIRGKWIVANPKNGEFMAHDAEEKIVGIVPLNANIEYVDDEEGHTSMYVDAILSKIYGKEIYDMFKKENQRNVSVEMITQDLDEDENGNIPITSLKICGVTILGKFVNGSCPNANMKVVQFSKDKANEFYETINSSELQNFANNRKKIFQNTDFKEEKMADTKDNKVTEKQDVTEETKDMAVSDKPQNKDTKPTKEENTMSCDNNSNKDKTKSMKDTEIDFSFLEKETENYQQLIKNLSTKDKGIIMQEYLKLAKEKDCLQKYKDDKMKEEKELSVNQIMAEVKDDVTEQEFEDLKQEGMTCKYEEINNFANKVKAFAYEKSKTKQSTKNKDSILRFELNTNQNNSVNKEMSATDIYNRVLEKR